jgi:hypothetical protein
VFADQSAHVCVAHGHPVVTRIIIIIVITIIIIIDIIILAGLNPNGLLTCRAQKCRNNYQGR